MSRNIVLIGFMGSGKTTVGRNLANELDFKFIDTDHLIESNTNMTISDIFKTYGEDYFRNLEKDVIKSISELRGYVISTGGGIVKYHKNILVLRKNGILFYLKASPDKIYNNILKDSDNRPLLKGSKYEKLTKIRILLQQREGLYNSASDYTINTDLKDIREIVGEIIKAYKNMI